MTTKIFALLWMATSAFAIDMYMVTNHYLDAACAGDVVEVNARPANVCVDSTIMRSTGEPASGGYIYTYEYYADTSCSKLNGKSTYVADTSCKVNEYGLYGKGYFSTGKPYYPEKGIMSTIYNEFKNGNCTGTGTITVYKQGVCIPGNRHSYYCSGPGASKYEITQYSDPHDIWGYSCAGAIPGKTTSYKTGCNTNTGGDNSYSSVCL